MSLNVFAGTYFSIKPRVRLVFWEGELVSSDILHLPLGLGISEEQGLTVCLLWWRQVKELLADLVTCKWEYLSYQKKIFFNLISVILTTEV